MSWEGNGLVEGLVGGFAEVAGGAEDADFVFDLDGDNGVLIGVYLAEMAHDGGEGAGVGIAVVFAEGGEDFEGFAVGVFDAGEAGLVGFDPFGGEVGEAVFPTAHPEEDEAEVVIAGALELLIDDGEVEVAFGGFDEVPGDDTEDGVEVGLGHAGPDGGHGFGVGGGGVAEFAGDADVGLAVDDEFGHVVPFFEMGHVGMELGGVAAGEGDGGGEEESDGGEGGFHWEPFGLGICFYEGRGIRDMSAAKVERRDRWIRRGFMRVNEEVGGKFQGRGWNYGGG